MKNSISRLALAVASVFAVFSLTAPKAHAGLLLEPYAQFGTGSWNDNGNSSSMTGFTYGGRAGFESFTGLMAGLDVMGGSFQDGKSPADTIVPTDIGVFVGFDFPVLLRVFAEYGFSSQLKYSGNFDDTFKGSDIKLGVGFKILPLLCLNVEYITGTYTKDNNGSLTNNLTAQTFQIGVSIPLNLL